MTEAPAPARPLVQRVARGAAWAALVIAPLVLRVACEAGSEMRAAAEAQAAGDEELEVVHLGRALRWRLPGASHDEQAIARLLEIAEAADADPARALAAYREIRSALLGSRALDVPHAEVVADVDARIAALMAAGDADAEATRLAELRAEPERSRLGLALAAATWILWAWASARFLLHGLDGRGRLVPGAGTRAGLLALVLMIAWMIAWRFA